MYRIFRLISLAFLWTLTGCDDPMQLKSPENKRLDSAITERLSKLLLQARIDSLNVLASELTKIDSAVKRMTGKINLFDSSIPVQHQANKYFSDWTLQLGLKENPFLNINAIQNKLSVIVALKQNELMLLEHVFDHGSSPKITSVQ